LPAEVEAPFLGSRCKWYWPVQSWLVFCRPSRKRVCVCVCLEDRCMWGESARVFIQVWGDNGYCCLDTPI